MTTLQICLKDLMAKEKINASQLAVKTGVKQPVIHRILSGDTLDPKIGTVASIAKYFKVSINELLGENLQTATKIPLLAMNEVHDNLGSSSVDKYFEVTGDIPEHCLAIKLCDSTMTPRFTKDTIIIVDPDIDPKDRDYVVIFVKSKNACIFRQLLMDGNDYFLKPLNSDFPVIHLTSEFSFVGVVIQASINLGHKNEIL